MELIGVRADTNGFWQRSVKSANALNNQLLCNFFLHLQGEIKSLIIDYFALKMERVMFCSYKATILKPAYGSSKMSFFECQWKMQTKMTLP